MIHLKYLPVLKGVLPFRSLFFCSPKITQSWATVQYPTAGCTSDDVREIKLDVMWSYVKQQTAKMTSEFVFFSSNPSLNHIKNRKMSPTIRHFHFTVQRAKDRRKKFHFCRLPFDVRSRNVKLNFDVDVIGSMGQNFFLDSK